MVYYYFAHALSLNDTCDSLSKCSMKLWNKAKVHQEERRVMVDERIRLKGINTKGALFVCVQLRLEIMRFIKLRNICGITAIIEINNIASIYIH